MLGNLTTYMTRFDPPLDPLDPTLFSAGLLFSIREAGFRGGVLCGLLAEPSMVP